MMNVSLLRVGPTILRLVMDASSVIERLTQRKNEYPPALPMVGFPCSLGLGSVKKGV